MYDRRAGWPFKAFDIDWRHEGSTGDQLSSFYSIQDILEEANVLVLLHSSTGRFNADYALSPIPTRTLPSMRTA